MNDQVTELVSFSSTFQGADCFDVSIKDAGGKVLTKHGKMANTLKRAFFETL